MTMTSTADQWMQFYQQPLMDDGQDHALAPHTEAFSDAAVMAPTPTLSPKGNVSKPIRRRSRASKKTPTTLLNANTTNFRSLVQQFTGCHSTAMSTLGVHKGPITLNFQQQSSSGHKIHHNTNRVVLPFSDRSYNNNSNQVHHQVPAPFPWQKQEEQQQQSGHSFDYVKSSGFLPSSGNSIRPTTSMDVSDGLLLDNDFTLPYLTANDFPNDTFYKNEL